MELREFLKRNSVDVTNNIWIFGYGSVIWKQGFDYTRTKRAFLPGYHRRFCVFSHDHRGTEDDPGLVLGLDKGGGCEGVVFELKGERQIRNSLQNLWDREMDSHYTPHYLDIWIEDRKDKALVFILDRDHPNFFDDIDKNEMADMIIRAKGHSGPNIDYLEATMQWLQDNGIPDEQVRNLWLKVQDRLDKRRG